MNTEVHRYGKLIFIVLLIISFIISFIYNPNSFITPASEVKVQYFILSTFLGASMIMLFTYFFRFALFKFFFTFKKACFKEKKIVPFNRKSNILLFFAFSVAILLKLITMPSVSFQQLALEQAVQNVNSSVISGGIYNLEFNKKNLGVYYPLATDYKNIMQNMYELHKKMQAQLNFSMTFLADNIKINNFNNLSILHRALGMIQSSLSLLDRSQKQCNRLNGKILVTIQQN